jgi:hypothetical protein
MLLDTNQIIRGKTASKKNIVRFCVWWNSKLEHILINKKESIQVPLSKQVIQCRVELRGQLFVFFCLSVAECRCRRAEPSHAHQRRRIPSRLCFEAFNGRSESVRLSMMHRSRWPCANLQKRSSRRLDSVSGNSNAGQRWIEIVWKR